MCLWRITSDFSLSTWPLFEFVAFSVTSSPLSVSSFSSTFVSDDLSSSSPSADPFFISSFSSSFSRLESLSSALFSRLLLLWVWLVKSSVLCTSSLGFPSCWSSPRSFSFSECRQTPPPSLALLTSSPLVGCLWRREGGRRRMEWRALPWRKEKAGHR